MSLTPLRVTALCSYPTVSIPKGAHAAFHAVKFIHAIKGEGFSGYAQIPVAGQERRLDASTGDDIIEWFGLMARRFVVKHKPRLLVPVPGRNCVGEHNVRASRTFRMASALADHRPVATASPLLRWCEPMKSAHRENGPRDARLLLEHLVVGKVPARPPKVILVDDVLTSGGHLRACEAALRASGMEVLGAICAGRAVQEIPDSFATINETLERLDADDGE